VCTIYLDSKCVFLQKLKNLEKRIFECRVFWIWGTALQLTLSSQVVSNGYTSKCLGHIHLTNPFNFLTFRHLGLSARCPNVKKIKNELGQYGTECFGRLIFATIRKSVGLKRLENQSILSVPRQAMLPYLQAGVQWIPCFGTIVIFFLSIYIYIYLCMHICVCMYI